MGLESSDAEVRNVAQHLNRRRPAEIILKHRTIPSDTGIYFVTSTISSHASIFTNDQVASIPLNSLEWFRSRRMWNLFAFCLMPNHLHILIEKLDSRPIEKVMGQFHSFTGHEIAKHLTESEDNLLLGLFRAVGKKKKDREFLIWQDSLAKCVESEYVLLESIEYIHNNPVNKNWHLVQDRADYLYSSARFYDRGEACFTEVDSYFQLLGETPSH